jgi:hypothetical protein
MNISNNGIDFEFDYYMKIIDYFKKQKPNRKDLEIWKDKSLMELMELLEHTQNRTLVKNAIILLISLFENMPPDTYNNRGHDIREISKKDKKILMEELREEFLPN